MDTFERLLANLSNTKVRRAILNGRTYLVAPATLIVPGVLNGSRGPLYYPPDMVERKAATWNGIPIVVRHPKDSGGKHVSAKAPGILDKYGIGFVFESTWNITGTDGASENGKALVGRHGSELWFDEENTRAFDKREGTRILANLEEGKRIELSTGLYTAEDEAPPNSAYNGKSYTHIVLDYTPDHLAILPDEVGACSVRDGCGVFNDGANGSGNDQTGKTKITKTEHMCQCGDENCEGCPEQATNGLVLGSGRFGNPQSTATGKYKPKGSGQGKGDIHEAAQRGSLVITEGDRSLGQLAQSDASWALDSGKWAKAMSAAKGHSESDYWPAAVAIYRRLGGKIEGAVTNKLNLKLGEANMATKQAPTKGKLTPNQRKEIVDNLTTNCDCWRGGKEDKDTLNEFSDEKLQRLQAALQRSQEQHSIVNAVNNCVEQGNLQLVTNEEDGTTEIRTGPKIKDLLANAPDEDDEDEDDDEEMDYVPPPKKGKGKGKMVKNRGGDGNGGDTIQRPLTMAEFEANMPAEARAVWNTAKMVEKRAREQAIARLKAIAEATTNQRKKALIVNKLKANPNMALNDLEDMLGLVEEEQPTDNYGNSSGASGAGMGDHLHTLNGFFPSDMPRVPNYIGASGGAQQVTGNEEVLDIEAAREEYARNNEAKGAKTA